MLGADPFCGALFVFRNKTKTALRILAYDGQGFRMCQKRLSCGRINQWPRSTRTDAFELQSLIWNFQPPLAVNNAFWLPRCAAPLDGFNTLYLEATSPRDLRHIARRGRAIDQQMQLVPSTASPKAARSHTSGKGASRRAEPPDRDSLRS